MYKLLFVLLLPLGLPSITYAQCGCGCSNCGPACGCGCQPGNGKKAPPEYFTENGFAGHGIIMKSRLTLAQMGAPSGTLGSAIWGWTDRTDPRGPQEYALFGLSNGTTFVNVTDPVNPVYVGRLPTATGNSQWRELKTFQNYVYVVSDGNGNHGMQVMDLTRLRQYAGTPITFSADTRYFAGNNPGAFSNAHTIYLNEATGYTYVFGTSTHSGGVHIVNVNNPLNPTFVNGYAGAGYIHDGQVVKYHGPDTRFTNQEILFGANSRSSGNTNDDTVQIINVNNKANLTVLGSATHQNARYIHQGWLTPDHKYFLVNDELDEYYSQRTTTTHVYDVTNLTNPVYKGGWQHPNNSFVIDHNMFIRTDPVYGDLAFSSNYTMGLRVIQLNNLAAGSPLMTELAWFDTFPADDAERSFNGQWGSYPFFDSGIIVAGDRQNGLFVLQLDLSSVPEPATWALIGLVAAGGAGYGYSRYRKQRKLWA
jgi:choice-of-anchor B domain-containing protein